MDHIEIERQKFELTVLHRRIVQNQMFAFMIAAVAVLMFLTAPGFDENPFVFFFQMSFSFILFLFVRKYVSSAAKHSANYKTNLWKIRDAYEQHNEEEAISK